MDPAAGAMPPPPADTAAAGQPPVEPVVLNLNDLRTVVQEMIGQMIGASGAGAGAPPPMPPEAAMPPAAAGAAPMPPPPEMKQAAGKSKLSELIMDLKNKR
jgi:hypothetical protein